MLNPHVSDCGLRAHTCHPDYLHVLINITQIAQNSSRDAILGKGHKQGFCFRKSNRTESKPAKLLPQLNVINWVRGLLAISVFDEFWVGTDNSETGKTTFAKVVKMGGISPQTCQNDTSQITPNIIIRVVIPHPSVSDIP